ncbi:magnesium/cobalt transporter CorA [Flavobacteriaceae bacterium F08102]|nr:magnesium/cobalt transporter CorA [Flavobacteriaceae bacterium F08102]
MKKPKRIYKQHAAKKAGLPPGSITYVGKERSEQATLELTIFNQEFDECFNAESSHTIRGKFKTNAVNWLNVDGIHNQDLIYEFQHEFGLDHLLLEDVTNTNQRPKVEEYEDYLFLSLKMIFLNEDNSIENEQVSLVLGMNYVISFQEKTGDVFHQIRERIHSTKGQIRTKKNDYLFYALVDSIIDNYFIVIEQIGNDLEELEDEIFTNPTQESLEKIQEKKVLLLSLRRAIYPLRESLNKLIRDKSPLIQDKNMKYFSDIYDHAIQIIDVIESYREIVSGLKDSYLSSLSFKMNQIMQVLTITASVFIPLTFVAGIYGMNFDHIPELHFKYGYFYFWGVVILLAVGLIFYFKRKKWL